MNQAAAQLQTLIDVALTSITQGSPLMFHYTTLQNHDGVVYAAAVVVLCHGEPVFTVSLFSQAGIANRKHWFGKRPSEEAPEEAIIFTAEGGLASYDAPALEIDRESQLIQGEKALRQALNQIHRAFSGAHRCFTICGVDLNLDAGFLASGYGQPLRWVNNINARRFPGPNGTTIEVVGIRTLLANDGFMPDLNLLSQDGQQWEAHILGNQAVQILCTDRHQLQLRPLAQVIHAVKEIARAHAISLAHTCNTGPNQARHLTNRHQRLQARPNPGRGGSGGNRPQASRNGPGRPGRRDSLPYNRLDDRGGSRGQLDHRLRQGQGVPTQ